MVGALGAVAGAGTVAAAGAVEGRPGRIVGQEDSRWAAALGVGSSAAADHGSVDAAGRSWTGRAGRRALVGVDRSH